LGDVLFPGAEVFGFLVVYGCLTVLIIYFIHDPLYLQILLPLPPLQQIRLPLKLLTKMTYPRRNLLILPHHILHNLLHLIYYRLLLKLEF